MTDVFGASPHDYPSDAELGLVDSRGDPGPVIECLTCSGWYCERCGTHACAHVLARYLMMAGR
jgi:hypothetical protein